MSLLRAAVGVATRRRRRWWLVLSPLTLVVLLLVVLVGIAVIGMFGGGAHFTTSAKASCGSAGGAPVPVNGSAPGLQPDQQANAQAIAGVALGLGLGQPGVLVGIVTAITESTLHNVTHGDLLGPDSIGLFQQRAPWGPAADRLDPVKSATMFYRGGQGGQRGLMSVPGWQAMPMPQAAQAVQGSQFADGSNYAANLAQAQAITAGLMAGQPAATVVPAAAPTTAVIVPLGPAPVDRSCGSNTLTPGAVYSPPGLEQNNSQDPSTFGWVHGGPLEPLVWQGHNAGQVARGTAKLWTAMLNELVPLIPGGLTNDIGCFEDRANVNNPSVLSFHAYGLACDWNVAQNPNGAPGYGRSGQYVLPAATHDVVAKYCAQWGGDFKGTPDPMHIEIHCTPKQVAAWSATQP